MEDPKGIYGGEQAPPLARRRPQSTFPSATATPDPFRHHSHRRRRRRRKEANRQGWFWLLALLLLAGFLGLLVYVRKHPTLLARPAPAAPTPVAEPLPPPVLAGVPDTAVDDVPEQTSDIKARILSWTSARRALEDAATLQREGKLEEAILRLQSALTHNPSDLDLRAALAEVLFQQRDFAPAAEQVTRVLAADPERVTARQMLALCYDNLHQHQDALVVIRWMLEKDPYAIEIHQMAARSCLALRMAPEAVEHLKRVTSVQRDNIAAFNLLAQAYTMLGQYDQAESTLEAVLKLDTKNSSSYYNLAVCRARQHQVADVVDVLNQAVTLFGAPFVASWAGSPEFAGLGTNQVFMTWKQNLTLSPGSPAGVTNTPVAATQLPAP